jgi:hypothetical protein
VHRALGILLERLDRWSAVDVATMADVGDPHYAPLIIDGVQHAVVAHSDPQKPMRSGEHFDARWARVPSQRFGGCLDALGDLAVEFAE